MEPTSVTVYRATIKRIDGEEHLQLPEDVTAKDFEDWMNKVPGSKRIKIYREPEERSSADIPYSK